MKTPLKIAMASVLALATAAPAFAQQYRPTDQYQRDLDRYQSDRETYDQNRAAYADTRADYAAARRDYERRRADWEALRADYDARYGYGSYVRIYGPAPIWDEARWSYVPPSAGSYGRDTAYTASAGCRSSNSSSVAGGIIGALAGAALGSNVAANGRGTEGAVLGAVVGGGIGAAVGHANDKYRCDSSGPYYSYNDTIPYREARDFRSGRYNYSYYNRQRCRLAAAPIDNYGEDYRYVRVCPDRSGRYRITG
jgi:hypothetical protein